MDRRRWLQLCLLVAGGARFARAEQPEIAVVVPTSRKLERLPAATLDAIFRCEMKSWPGGDRIVPFNFPPRHPLRVTFDRAVLNMTPEQVARYWIDRRVRGGERPPRQVETVDLMLKVVAKLDGAIGYLPSAELAGGVRVVARIRDGKVWEP